MLFLMFMLTYQTDQMEEVISFLPPDRDERFTLEIRDQQNERKLRVIAESLRKNFNITIIVDETANVQIMGNFSDVSVNEFLTYIVKTHKLEWYKVGEIYHFSKPAEPNFILEVEFEKDTNLLTVKAKNVNPTQMARELTDKIGKNVLIGPEINGQITGYIKDLPPATAMSALLASYRLTFVDYDDYYRIERVTAEDAKPKRPKPNATPDSELKFQNERFSGHLEASSPRQALDMLAEQARFSTRFLDEPEGGGVNLYLDNAPLGAVLNKIFLGTAFSYKLLDGVYLIGAKNRPELTTSEMIIVKHMNAQNVLDYLSGEASSFQTFSLPTRPSNFGSRYDDRFTSSSNSNFGNRSNNRGNFSNQSGGGSLGNGPTSISPTSNFNQQGGQSLKKEISLGEAIKADIILVREHNALLVTATQDIISEIKGRLELVDKPVPQVLIQALVVDYRTDDMDRYGLSISNGDFSYFPELDVSVEANRDADNRFRITKLPSNFEVRVQALATQGKARILSKPHIATLSGHEAYIEVGLTQSILLQTETLVGDETPRSQITERIETVEANISLRVIPWVTASGEITTYIEPIFNSFLGQVQNNVPPPISTRRLQSTVRLKNGETIILGGLIEETLRKNNQGIPGISRIPILGYLFKNQTREYAQSELVIYLTPYVYYGDEGSVVIIKEREGLDYPLDVKRQQQLIKPKKKRFWRRNKKKKDRGVKQQPLIEEPVKPLDLENNSSKIENHENLDR